MLITDHAYAPEYDGSDSRGQYCVQFMTFTRDGGEVVRKWWEDRCIEWCYGRLEDGKFGDQKYLDDWPERFSTAVHVMINKELALAPWNATRFPHGNAVFWHFHGLRILVEKGGCLKVDFGTYPLHLPARLFVYQPYLSDLRCAIDFLSSHGVIVRSQGNKSAVKWDRGMIRGILNRRWRIRLNNVVRL